MARYIWYLGQGRYFQAGWIIFEKEGKQKILLAAIIQNIYFCKLFFSVKLKEIQHYRCNRGIWFIQQHG